MNVNEFIRKNKFIHYCDLVRSGKHAMFEVSNKKTASEGFVYLWVELLGNSKKVVYVGKAGKRMENRANQHNAGFRGGSKRGADLSKLILKGISNNKKYKVYIRKSPIRTVFGVKISSCESEEKALIQKFDNLWNKLK